MAEQHKNESTVLIGGPDELGTLMLDVAPSELKTVVPVIFVPGIFGSRLQGANGGYLWDPDNEGPLVSHYAKGKLSALFRRRWTDEQINQKLLRLQGTAEVMSDYSADDRSDIVEEIAGSPVIKQLKLVTGSNDTEQLANDEYERRKDRGWFGPLSIYHPLLERIDLTEDEHFIFRAYGFGYDWRHNLADAAEKLNERIAEVLATQDYPDVGRQGREYGPVHGKAIVITHSQGSIVARYASEVGRGKGSIQGIIHFNQPTTGAPLLFRRFVAGTGDERDFPFPGIKEGATNNVLSEVLGTSSYHFTRVAGEMVGGLQLLPTNDYDAVPGTMPSWLDVDENIFDGEINDVFEDIYLSDRIGLVCHKRYDREGNPKPYTEGEFQRKRRMRGIEFSQPAPSNSPYHLDNMRLRPNGAMSAEVTRETSIQWDKIEECIRQAGQFHQELRLKQHDNTWVIRSTAFETVNHVQLRLDEEGILRCPYDRDTAGDGTVPLVSQEALLRQHARPAGGILSGKGALHADIVSFKPAMEQALSAILGEGGLVASLRPASQESSQ